ncbi:MAG TPA: pilus assembly protein N-terminal domain-containing protein [Thermohalobaculum sp.]|nr:pilus assembly protein N-terminal domain-containing protein [Thermohalobaculum sp.]
MTIMRTAAAVGLALAATVATASAAPEGPSVLRTAKGLPSVPITVVEDRAVVIESAVPFVEISVAQPTIADVTPLSDRTIFVFGRGRGTTTLTLLGEGGRPITHALVEVTPDVAAVRRAIDDALSR